jgi:hypothetical protein
LNGWSFLKQGGSCRVKIYTLFFIVSAMTILIAAGLFSVHAGEGDNWQAMHPEWLWFDGFETQDTLTVNYQDVSSNSMSVVTGEAFEGTHSLRQSYAQGPGRRGLDHPRQRQRISRPRFHALVPQI